jgi:hypothetical protein
MMRLQHAFLPVLLGLAAFTAAPAFAKVTHFAFTLSGKSETPPNDSAGSGSGTATYDDATHAFSWNITYQGLTTPVTAAHFHGPAKPGQAAPPTLPIDASALKSPITGTATLTDAQAQQLLGSQWYFNVHTQKIPGGELRGDLSPSP